MERIGLKQLVETIKSYKDKRVILTFHSIGDTDSVASAFALARYFKNASIAAPDYITSNSRRILGRLGFDHNSITTKFDSNADMAVMLDVNNFEDCGAFERNIREFRGMVLIIDHHVQSKIEKGNVLVFNDESHNSAASIVYDVSKRLGLKIDRRLANLLVAGILSDSAELRNAFPKTFVQIGELLETSGIDYPSLLLEIQHLASPETRAEFMRDLFSSSISIVNGILVLHGQARMHANKIADDAIKIGADISLFYTKNKKDVSFSARMRPPLDKTYSIHLGKLMRDLAPIIEGRGGGHPCAAGAYGSSLSNSGRFAEAFFEHIAKRTSNV